MCVCRMGAVCVGVQCVHELCKVRILCEVQECAVCVQVCALAGVGVGAFEHAKRSGRENVHGVRRGALRGGAVGAEEREDDEGPHLHCRDTSFFFLLMLMYCMEKYVHVLS